MRHFNTTVPSISNSFCRGSQADKFYKAAAAIEREDLKNVLQAAARRALDGEAEMADAILNELVEDMHILEATKAFKISTMSNDMATMMADFLNLMILMGEAR